MPYNHRIEPFTEKLQMVCHHRGVNYRTCGAPVSYRISFNYQFRGREATRTTFVCKEHGIAFARRHGLARPVD